MAEANKLFTAKKEERKSESVLGELVTRHGHATTADVMAAVRDDARKKGFCKVDSIRQRVRDYRRNSVPKKA